LKRLLSKIPATYNGKISATILAIVQRNMRGVLVTLICQAR